MRRFRGLRRWNTKKVALIAAVVVFVACLGFFVKQWNDTGNPGSDVVAGSDLPTGGASDSPSASASKAKASTAPGPFNGLKGLPTGRPSTRDRFGNLIQPRTVTMTVTSTARLYQVGYLVPTSLDSPYGRGDTSGTHWTLTVHATGRSPVAAIFMQAGRTGAPVTCTITIDGQVGDTKTTTKPWERQLCVA